MTQFSGGKLLLRSSSYQSGCGGAAHLRSQPLQEPQPQCPEGSKHGLGSPCPKKKKNQLLPCDSAVLLPASTHKHTEIARRAAAARGGSGGWRPLCCAQHEAETTLHAPLTPRWTAFLKNPHQQAGELELIHPVSLPWEPRCTPSSAPLLPLRSPRLLPAARPHAASLSSPCTTRGCCFPSAHEFITERKNLKHTAGFIRSLPFRTACLPQLLLGRVVLYGR